MKFSRTARMLAGLLCVGALACQSEDKVTKERLDKMIAQAEDVEKKIDKAGQRGGFAAGNAPSGPQPGRPDPSAVYAVPIEGNPFEGPATAKVTIVEAAEFA